MMTRKAQTALCGVAIAAGILWATFFIAPIAEWRYAVYQVNHGVHPPAAKTMPELRTAAPFWWLAAKVMGMDLFEEGHQRPQGNVLLVLCERQIGFGVVLVGFGLLFLPLSAKAIVRIPSRAVAGLLVTAGALLIVTVTLNLHTK
jgi:hypothetical protein